MLSSTAAAALTTTLSSLSGPAVLNDALFDADLAGVSRLRNQESQYGGRILGWNVPTGRGYVQVWCWESDGGRVEVRSLEGNGVERSSVSLSNVPVAVVVATVVALANVESA